MKSRNRAHFLKWAVIGGIVAVGVAGLNIAIGQGGNAPLMPTADGWSVKADYDPKDWPTMHFELTITNAEAASRTWERTIKLVRQEFKGSLASRVARPGDVEKKELETQSLKVKVPGRGSKTVQLVFESKADDLPDKSTFERRRISYVLMSEVNGHQIPIGAARRPAK